MRKKIFLWLSGFFAGIFLGALISCPRKEISLPVSVLLCLLFGVLSK